MSPHPRLRAELLPCPDGWRLWLDDQRWLELSEPPAALVTRLRRSDGWSPPSATESDPPDEATAAAWPGLVALLSGHSLMAGGPSEAPIAAARIAVLGSGELARQLCLALVRAGVRSMVVLDPRRPSSQEWPNSRSPTCGHALAHWVSNRRRADASAVLTIEELVDCTDLVLVAGHTVEPDRLALDELTRRNLAHLVLRANRDLARIGPLVEPGRTPCLTCQDLALGQLDRRRPALVGQLATQRAQPDRTITAAAVARAVLEVEWWCRGHRERLAGRVESLDRLSPEVPVTLFSLHPACSCQLVD